MRSCHIISLNVVYRLMKCMCMALNALNSMYYVHFCLGNYTCQMAQV